jgi:hypothetical protein
MLFTQLKIVIYTIFQCEQGCAFEFCPKPRGKILIFWPSEFLYWNSISYSPTPLTRSCKMLINHLK